MCNLYRLDKGQDHLRRFFKVKQDDTGNMPPLLGIFPDMMAPVIRTDGASSNGAAGRVMEMMRWGMPTPPRCVRPGAIDRGVTNVSDTRSPHWYAWLKPEYRCLVPATAFSEPTDEADQGRHTLYAFLTTQANAVVRPIHSKAMPILLTTPAEQDAWLSAPLAEALRLQRPLPDEALRMVALVEKADEWVPAA